MNMNVPTIFHYGSILTGLMLLVIGVAATFWPAPLAKGFGIATSGSGLPYVTATGIRDFSLGLIVFYFFSQAGWQALGAVHMAIAPIALSDFMSVAKRGPKQAAAVHLMGVFWTAGYGAWLFFLSGT